MKIQVLLDQARSVSTNRPAGYLAELVASGTLENGVLTLDTERYSDLCKKYRPRIPSASSNTTKPSYHFLKHPGCLFAIVIRKITGKGPCPNKCRTRITQMNQWGWWKCWRNRKTIAGWLAEEARRRGHQITDTSALDFLKAAWKEARSPKIKLPKESVSTTN